MRTCDVYGARNSESEHRRLSDIGGSKGEDNPAMEILVLVRTVR